MTKETVNIALGAGALILAYVSFQNRSPAAGGARAPAQPGGLLNRLFGTRPPSGPNAPGASRIGPFFAPGTRTPISGFPVLGRPSILRGPTQTPITAGRPGTVRSTTGPSPAAALLSWLFKPATPQPVATSRPPAQPPSGPGGSFGPGAPGGGGPGGSRAQAGSVPDQGAGYGVLDPNIPDPGAGYGVLDPSVPDQGAGYGVLDPGVSYDPATYDPSYGYLPPTSDPGYYDPSYGYTPPSDSTSVIDTSGGGGSEYDPSYGYTPPASEPATYDPGTSDPGYYDPSYGYTDYQASDTGAGSGPIGTDAAYDGGYDYNIYGSGGGDSSDYSYDPSFD